MKKIILSLLFLFSLLSTAYSNNKSDENIFNLATSEGEVFYDIEIHEISIDTMTMYNYSSRWGISEDKKAKNTVITNIIIKNKNKEYYLPLSAYCDLANITNNKISSWNDGFIIEIFGGKGHSTYEAKLYFKNGKILRREVQDVGEMSGISWERTYYPIEYEN